MSCKETCKEIGPEYYDHTAECMFNHFLSYSGYWAQSESVRMLMFEAFKAALPKCEHNE